MDPIVSKRVDILVETYKALKSEQQARIGFRDNLLYVTLAGTGAVLAFTLSKDGTNMALLAIPWLVLILGWTYLVNDEKISAVGRYVRGTLESELQALIGPDRTLFGWEEVHRLDKFRRSRKAIQLGIDLITFVSSGIGAIVVYLLRQPHPPTAARWMCGLGAAAMLFLTFEIVRYADLGKGK